MYLNVKSKERNGATVDFKLEKNYSTWFLFSFIGFKPLTSLH